MSGIPRAGSRSRVQASAVQSCSQTVSRLAPVSTNAHAILPPAQTHGPLLHRRGAPQLRLNIPSSGGASQSERPVMPPSPLVHTSSRPVRRLHASAVLESIEFRSSFRLPRSRYRTGSAIPARSSTRSTSGPQVPPMRLPPIPVYTPSLPSQRVPPRADVVNEHHWDAHSIASSNRSRLADIGSVLDGGSPPSSPTRSPGYSRHVINGSLESAKRRQPETQGPSPDGLSDLGLDDKSTSSTAPSQQKIDDDDDVPLAVWPARRFPSRSQLPIRAVEQQSSSRAQSDILQGAPANNLESRGSLSRTNGYTNLRGFRAQPARYHRALPPTAKNSQAPLPRSNLPTPQHQTVAIEGSARRTMARSNNSAMKSINSIASSEKSKKQVTFRQDYDDSEDGDPEIRILSNPRGRGSIDDDIDHGCLSSNYGPIRISQHRCRRSSSLPSIADDDEWRPAIPTKGLFVTNPDPCEPDCKCEDCFLRRHRRRMACSRVDERMRQLVETCFGFNVHTEFNEENRRKQDCISRLRQLEADCEKAIEQPEFSAFRDYDDEERGFRLFMAWFTMVEDAIKAEDEQLEAASEGEGTRLIGKAKKVSLTIARWSSLRWKGSVASPQSEETSRPVEALRHSRPRRQRAMSAPAELLKWSTS